jgi:hypothetical protein
MAVMLPILFWRALASSVFDLTKLYSECL